MKALFIFTFFCSAILMFLAFGPKQGQPAKIKTVEHSDIKDTVSHSGIKEDIENWLKKSAGKTVVTNEEIPDTTEEASDTETVYYVQPEKPESFSGISLGGLEKTEKDFGDMIRKKARKKAIPENIAIALAVSRSNGKPDLVCRNADGSINRGLYQLNDHGFGSGFGENVLFCPEINTEIALGALAGLISKYGDSKTAIIAFQVGPSKIDSLIKNGGFNKGDYGQADSVMSLAEKINNKNEGSTDGEQWLPE
jgi:hypothetical protein